MLKKKIKNLIALIKGTEIEEIEVSSFWGAQKIRLSKGSKISQKSNANYIPQSEIIKSEKSPTPIKEDEISNPKENKIEQNIIKETIKDFPQDLNLQEIKAPLVGTYYSSAKPSDPPFINIGDKIKKGDTICIIEAMKIFNEIESDVSGTIREICVDNGNPVEFDQLIVKILVE